MQSSLQIIVISKTKLISLLYLSVLGTILAGCTLMSPRVMESPLPVQSPIATPAAAAQRTGIPENAPALTPPAAPVPGSESGTASATGILYTSTGNGPIPETSFYLMRANGEVRSVASPREEDGDIRGRSDLQGRFVLGDIPPGKYNLFVWAPFNWIPVPVSESDETFKVFDLQPDRVNDLGQLELSWP